MHCVTTEISSIQHYITLDSHLEYANYSIK